MRYVALEEAFSIAELDGRQPPPWIVTPGLAVNRDNLVEAYLTVWRAPAPTLLSGS